MKKRTHLPLYGVGPLYVITIIILTVVGLSLSQLAYFAGGRIPILKTPFSVVGIAMFLLALYFWIGAFFQSNVRDNIRSNTLVTTGVYAYVRNPIYSAFMLLCTGVVLLANNLWLLILPVLYWAFMTVLMINTEEKWLLALYGEAYVAYCKQVNRCIPWFTREM